MFKFAKICDLAIKSRVRQHCLLTAQRFIFFNFEFFLEFLGTLMTTMCITMNKQAAAVTANDYEFGVRQPILLNKKIALFWMKVNKNKFIQFGCCY